MTPIQCARAVFAEQFEQHSSLLEPTPGRFNFIGNHTDYSGSFVLPCAIDCAKTGAGVIA